MKKIVVIGSNGMAGHVVKLYLESIKNYEVWGIARNVQGEKLIDLDVSDEKGLARVFATHHFDVVINCIGLLNKTAEDNPEMAVWYNSYFPHLLEKLAKTYSYKLIHISTDCVFSGKEGGYLENSFKNGVGFYAQSKALGEVINDKDLTFRTSIIGPELKQNGIGLFHWFMNQKEPIKGYSNAFWTGVTTIELAKAIDKAIVSDLKGLYHLVNGSKISKYDLVKLFNENFIKELKIASNGDYFVDKSLINTRTDFDYLVPSYETMIVEMKEWMLTNKEIYPHYQ